MRWLGALLCALMLNGCTTMNFGLSFFRSADDFVPLKNDGRIRYEPGAESLAIQVQPYLDEAIATVEEAHYRKFSQPVHVQVCASAQRFSSMAGVSPKVKGAMHPTNGLLLNADLFATPERIKGIITHELSHLLMQQQRGLRFIGAGPPWFNEGFAAFVSDGGGADKVSENEARDLMLAGRIFQAKDAASWWSYDTSESFGYFGNRKEHMFYRQSMMFVAWLKQRNESKFKAFLLAIQDGMTFREEFSQSFGGDVKTLQTEFIGSL